MRKTPTQKRKFLRTGKFSVYILECNDGSFYTGYTNDLPARIKLHKSGRGSKYVRSKRPLKLVYCREYRYYKIAFAEELRIKALSRSGKERIVAGVGLTRKERSLLRKRIKKADAASQVRRNS